MRYRLSKYIKVIILFSFFVMSGCSTVSGNSFIANTGFGAKVKVCRAEQASSLFFNNSFTVNLDGEKISQVRSFQDLYISVDPGIHIISLESKKNNNVETTFSLKKDDAIHFLVENEALKQVSETKWDNVVSTNLAKQEKTSNIIGIIVAPIVIPIALVAYLIFGD